MKYTKKKTKMETFLAGNSIPENSPQEIQVLTFAKFNGRFHGNENWK